MEEKENKEKKNEENIVKITITKEAGQSLSELVEKVNEGFDGGRVHRQDVASWIIGQFKKLHAESDILQIRQVYYDASAMLETAYRKMKETGEIPEFLKDALQKQFQNAGTTPKRLKKNLLKESINDGLEKYEEAV
ncbi:MAG: hypothetical protein AB7F59_14810 [Bdellovibrionales bacterium]